MHHHTLKYEMPWLCFQSNQTLVISLIVTSIPPYPCFVTGNKDIYWGSISRCGQTLEPFAWASHSYYTFVDDLNMEEGVLDSTFHQPINRLTD